MQFIDTHSHIYGEEYDEDRDEVIARAREAGAVKILLPNIDANSVGPMIALCDQYPDLCLPMMGLHPTELPDDPAPLLQQMESMIATGRFIAVGEVGVDLYWDASRREEQMDVLRVQAEWSIKYDLPLVIHSRSAHAELMEVLTPLKNKLHGGIFHCFGGTEEEACELLTFPGFALGIGGVVTFKKSKLPAILKQYVPLERLVVETDAPYLAPTPHRGTRNESAYIPIIIEKLADAYEISPEEVAAITTENAKRIFKI